MKRKKLAAFGLVIALTASSSSAAFAAAVPAASNMETTAVQQMDQAEETDTDILSDSEAVELQQEIASYSNDGILLTAAAPSTIGGTTIADCDYTVKIPMAHGVDSLNVAAASAVAFWQLGNRT